MVGGFGWERHCVLSWEKVRHVVLYVLGPWVAVRSEERAVFLVNMKGLEAFLLTATFGTPAGSG